MREEIVHVDAKDEAEARCAIKDAKPFHHVVSVEKEVE